MLSQNFVPGISKALNISSLLYLIIFILIYLSSMQVYMCTSHEGICPTKSRYKIKQAVKSHTHSSVSLHTIQLILRL